MISANQLYKQSKTNLPFKEWLKQTQEKGILQNHEKMYNLIESDNNDNEEQDQVVNTKNKKTTSQDAKTKLGMVNILGFIGLAVLVYGLTRTSAE